MSGLIAQGTYLRTIGDSQSNYYRHGCGFRSNFTNRLGSRHPHPVLGRATWSCNTFGNDLPLWQERTFTIRVWCRRLFPLFLLASLAFILTGRGIFSLRFSSVAITCAAALTLIVTSQRGSRLAKLFESRFLRTLEKYSYAMYIFQSPAIPLAAGFSSIDGFEAMGLNRYVATAIYTVLMFILTFLLAVLSWNLLEKHCLKLRSS